MTEPEIEKQEVAYPHQKRWRDENKKAVWAQAALRSALKRGLIEAKPCEICGAEPAEGHHDDYDKPADVRWLCRAHHRAHHAAEKRSAAA